MIFWVGMFGVMVGRSLNGVTVTVNVSVAVSVPSSTVRVIRLEPEAFAKGVICTVQFPGPVSTSAIPPGATTVASLEVPVTLRSAIGMSVSFTVNGTAPLGVSSAIVISLIDEIVGGASTAATVNRKADCAVPPLASVTVRVTVATPERLIFGITLTLLADPPPPKTISALSARLVFDESDDIVNSVGEVSRSVMVNPSGPVEEFSLIFWGVIDVMVGRSFTELTVRTKDMSADKLPSLTRKVIFVTPLAFIFGVMVTLRVAPVPPMAMPPASTSARFDEVPVTTNVLTGVFGSPT